MIDFVELVQRKTKNMIIAVCLIFLSVTLLHFQIIPDSFGILVLSCMFLSTFYVMHWCPYFLLLEQHKMSKKIYEKIQYRTEILKTINPSYNYDYEVNQFLNCHFFIKEQEIQNNVNSILEDSIVADDVKSNLKQVQREISKLLKTYANGLLQICNMNIGKLIFGIPINKKNYPVYRFFSDEDLEFFKNYH